MSVEVSCIFHVSANLFVGAFFIEEGGVGKPEDKLSQCILCVWRTHLTCYMHSLYVFLHLSLSSINSANVSMQIKSTKWTKCHFKHAKRPAEDTLTFTSDSCIARHSIREARRLIWDDRQNQELSISIHVIRVTFILHLKLFSCCCWEISLQPRPTEEWEATKTFANRRIEQQTRRISVYNNQAWKTELERLVSSMWSSLWEMQRSIIQKWEKTEKEEEKWKTNLKVMTKSVLNRNKFSRLFEAKKYNLSFSALLRALRVEM